MIAHRHDAFTREPAERRLERGRAAIARRPHERAAGLGADRAEAHPQASAAAEPLLDPPGVCRGFQGLRVGEGSKQANSTVTVLPRIIAPARRIAATSGASVSAR